MFHYFLLQKRIIMFLAILLVIAPKSFCDNYYYHPQCVTSSVPNAYKSPTELVTDKIVLATKWWNYANRVVPHEYGHTAGLRHPDDPNVTCPPRHRLYIP